MRIGFYCKRILTEAGARARFSAYSRQTFCKRAVDIGFTRLLYRVQGCIALFPAQCGEFIDGRWNPEIVAEDRDVDVF